MRVSSCLAMCRALGLSIEGLVRAVVEIDKGGVRITATYLGFDGTGPLEEIKRFRLVDDKDEPAPEQS